MLGHRRGRRDVVMTAGAAYVLDSRGRIHSVAEQYDLAFDIAHLADHQRTRMQRGAKSWGSGVTGRIVIATRTKSLFDREDAGDGLGGRTGPIRPGHDDLITNVAIDFAARLEHRLGNVPEHLVEKSMESRIAKHLGELGRIHEIDEQNDAAFQAGAMIASGDEREDGARAQQA